MKKHKKQKKPKLVFGLWELSLGWLLILTSFVVLIGIVNVPRTGGTATLLIHFIGISIFSIIIIGLMFNFTEITTNLIQK